MLPLTIIWDDQNGAAVPDGKTWEKFKELLDDLLAGKEVRIGSEVLITAFRVAVKERTMSSKVQVQVGDDFYLITPNGSFSRQNGSLVTWPKGFCDATLDLLTKLGDK